MEDFTIDKALKEGIKAHRAGQVQKADRFYTAILKAQPKHPDANHNMGILAVGVGKAEQALSFFKTALEANPKNVNFWLSYINTLINIGQLEKAEASLELAKRRGAEGESFDKLENHLKASRQVATKISSSEEETRTLKVNILDELKLDQALRLARNKSRQGALDEAKHIYQDILIKLPKNKRASDGLRDLVNNKTVKDPIPKDPPKNQILTLIEFFRQGQLLEALKQAEALCIEFSNSAVLYNIQGAIAHRLGQIDDSIRHYNKAIAIKPDYAEAYSNLGNTLQEQGNLEEAIDAYNKAIDIQPKYADAYNNLGNTLHLQGRLDKAIDAYKKALSINPSLSDAFYNMGNAFQQQGKLEEALTAYNNAIARRPDHAEAHNNMGAALREQGKLTEAIESCKNALKFNPNHADAYNNMGTALQQQDELQEAIEAYKKAVEINPNHADAYNNMGIALQQQGKLEKAIEAYKRALKIEPNNPDAFETFQNLTIQLSPSYTPQGYCFVNEDTPAKPGYELRPKFQVQNLIKAFLEEDFNEARLRYSKFKALDPKILAQLAPKDKIFCTAYSNFIGKLMEENLSEIHDTKNNVYHFGESHCLSYAHRNVTICGEKLKIVPNITFGGKAFHFMRNDCNSFKAITKSNFSSVPHNSQIFISFGEIDCRPNEGFISAARKLDTPIEKIVSETVSGYVRWFNDLNLDKSHRLHFINIPAPVYDERYEDHLNLQVAKTVMLFNAELKKYSQKNGHNMLDVFKFSSGKRGFSNQLFHLDNRHLKPDALINIQQQLA